MLASHDGGYHGNMHIHQQHKSAAVGNQVTRMVTMVTDICTEGDARSSEAAGDDRVVTEPQDLGDTTWKIHGIRDQGQGLRGRMAMVRPWYDEYATQKQSIGQLIDSVKTPWYRTVQHLHIP